MVVVIHDHNLTLVSGKTTNGLKCVFEYIERKGIAPV